ncbi:YfcL family protein [Aeromonas simiae]|nr:YfcL family protein [Aeromonas simiae]MDO2948871.1 YfcL family protein [Aeromonas simiae]MDO2951981.1 YfcL family protein [Aeromonas simiae]MDO2956254.1 YfcL family protein [Aeromonas simiae]
MSIQSTLSIQEYEQKLLALIDHQVASASDDELFAGGYLRGHISLAVARAELEGRNLVRDVKNYVMRSLNEAILQGELSDEDQALVLAMWQQLQQQAEA